MKYYEESGYCDPEKLHRSLCFILDALSDEAKDRAFYQCLLKMAPECDREIIKSIRNDEIKHFKMFRMIFQEITCESPPRPEKAGEFEEPEHYCAALQKSVFGELEAVEFYRRIMFGLCSQRHRDMLFEIITDEIKHSVKFNFLYTKNRCECERN